MFGFLSARVTVLQGFIKFLLFLLLVTSCHSKKTNQPVQPDTETVAAPLYSIKVMSYNILNGAGVDPDFEPYAADLGYPGNRLSQVLDIIIGYNPDILGVQEAAGWDRGNPAVVDSVANILNMNYFLGRCIRPESGFNHVVLFTKYKIEQAMDYPENFSRAALQATLVDKNGRRIKVFVVHIINEADSLIVPELKYISNVFKPSTDTLSIVMGDMNTSKFNFKKYNPGWKLITNHGIDQIWISDILNIEGQFLTITDYFAEDFLRRASDHLPAISKIDIYE